MATGGKQYLVFSIKFKDDNSLSMYQLQRFAVDDMNNWVEGKEKELVANLEH